MGDLYESLDWNRCTLDDIHMCFAFGGGGSAGSDGQAR
jgi:hypothetical protein